MITVLDVSGAVEILFQRKKEALFRDAFDNAAWVIAPGLYIAEISNVFWKYQKTGVISHEECMQMTTDGIEMIDDYFDCLDLWKEALGEGIREAHSVYDMYYLVLTRRNDATLITNDDRLARLCNSLKIAVCH